MSDNLPHWIVVLMSDLDEVTEIDLDQLEDIEDWDHMVTSEYVTEEIAFYI